MKAYMIRKTASVADWEAAKERIEYYNETMPKQEVVIEKTITLTPAEFKEFCEDFFEERDFIKENASLMKMDENKIWHCVEVTAKGSRLSVLVDCEGYDYARYTAVIKR